MKTESVIEQRRVALTASILAETETSLQRQILIKAHETQSPLTQLVQRTIRESSTKDLTEISTRDVKEIKEAVRHKDAQQQHERLQSLPTT